MLFQNHIRLCLIAALAAACAASGTLAGQSQQPDADALPDAGDAVAAYLTIRAWTNSLDAPPLSDPQSLLPLRDASGASVTLRRFGRILGSGSAVHTRSADRELLARRATGRALAQALGDAAVAGLPEDVRDTVGRGLTLELEIAGPLEPMLGRTYMRIARELEPGVDGVAMRRGNQWAMLFPGQLLASNTAGNVAARLPALAAELGLPAGDLSTHIQEYGASVYRFRTLHLAQSDPGGLPFEVFRGDRLVSDAAVTSRGIAEFADGLASHLLRRIHDGEDSTDDVAQRALGLLGDYRPVADAFRPLTAPPLDQALVSFALNRYAAAPGAEADVVAEARDQAARLLRDLSAAAGENADWLDNPAVAAAIVYAAAAGNVYGEAEDDVSNLAMTAATVVAQARISDFRDAHLLAMVAGASARLLAVDADSPVQAEAVRELLDTAWDAVPEHQHVALLPWIGWGELDYAQATGEPMVRTEELRQIRDALDASRVTYADETAAPDLQGGFALADGVAARPTAQVTRPAAFLATMLREPALTDPEEASPNLGRHLQTMRFLMQLSVREQSLWAYRNAGRARGGIKAATWDSDMPTAAQAMALLAAVETLWSLQR